MVIGTPANSTNLLPCLCGHPLRPPFKIPLTPAHTEGNVFRQRLKFPNSPFRLKHGNFYVFSSKHIVMWVEGSQFLQCIVAKHNHHKINYALYHAYKKKILCRHQKSPSFVFYEGEFKFKDFQIFP